MFISRAFSCSWYQRKNQTGFFLPINSAAELARRVNTEQHNTSPPLQNRSTQMPGLDYAIYSHQQTLVHIRGPLISGNHFCKYMHFSMSEQCNRKTKKARDKGISNLNH